MQIGRIPLREQVKYFEESRSYMKNVMGENGSNEFLKKAIFSLTVGSNDVLSYVKPSIPFLGHNKVSPTMLQDFMLSNFTIHLKVTQLITYAMPFHSYICLITCLIK